MAHDDMAIEWRGAVGDAELVELAAAHGGTVQAGWWDRVSRHSLGWVTARASGGQLISFVNVAWDGGDHAFLVDTKTRPSHQHRGLGRAVVLAAVERARAAGCEWIFVDYGPELVPCYEGACGFRPTHAGLIKLR